MVKASSSGRPRGRFPTIFERFSTQFGTAASQQSKAHSKDKLPLFL